MHIILNKDIFTEKRLVINDIQIEATREIRRPVEHNLIFYYGLIFVLLNLFFQ